MNGRLVEYAKLSATQRQQLLAIELPAEQVRFAGDIFGSLNWLPAEPCAQIKGFALLIDDVPRGFLVLKHGAFLPFCERPDVVTLHGLIVDRHVQGLGHGKACVLALPALVRSHWPQVTQLMLSVDPGNRAAHGLYLALGWRDCGPTFRAVEGFERRLVLDL
jgi:ribosomal protein S18 acetylase RimI-like enzyme